MLNQVIQAQITAHSPPDKVQIVFKMMGQSVSAPARLGREYIDPIRARQKPMPAIGSWGIILLPNGDIRNATWVCAVSPSLADALTQSQPADPTDPFIDYEAHFSGHWDFMDGKGNVATQFADGSTLVMGATSGVPTIYRRIVDEKQTQQIKEFTRAQRILAPPSGFYANFHHISGTSFSVDPSGNFMVSGATGASMTLSFGPSGAHTTLIIDSSGHAFLNLSGSQTFDITQNNASASDWLVLVSKFLTKFNAHTHSGVQAGGANSGAPTTALVSGDVNARPVKIST